MQLNQYRIVKHHRVVVVVQEHVKRLSLKAMLQFGSFLIDKDHIAVRKMIR